MSWFSDGTMGVSPGDEPRNEWSLNPEMERFAQRAPLPVMARPVLERCLGVQDFEAWFERVAQAQSRRRCCFRASTS